MKSENTEKEQGEIEWILKSQKTDENGAYPGTEHCLSSTLRKNMVGNSILSKMLMYEGSYVCFAKYHFSRSLLSPGPFSLRTQT